jgi:hypothetical protein
MGIPSQFWEMAHLRKVSLQMAEEASGSNSIRVYCAGSQRSTEGLNVRLKNLTENREGQWRVPVGIGADGKTALSLERRSRRKILRKDEPGPEWGMLDGQVAEQTAQAKQVNAASAIGQARVFVAETLHPTEQMRVTLQFRDLAKLWVVRLEIGNEAMDGGSKVSMQIWVRLDGSIQHRMDFVMGRRGTHKSRGNCRRVRFCTARAYSRQTSWGESCT